MGSQWAECSVAFLQGLMPNMDIVVCDGMQGRVAVQTTCISIGGVGALEPVGLYTVCTGPRMGGQGSLSFQLSSLHSPSLLLSPSPRNFLYFHLSLSLSLQLGPPLLPSAVSAQGTGSATYG